MGEQTIARLPAPLSDLPSGCVLEPEWNTFRRERPQLLAEGHEGRWVLVKGNAILGIWDTRAEACREGYQRFLLAGFLVQQLHYEPERPLRAGNLWR